MNVKVVLKVKDVELTLSLEEATELRQILEQLVGPKRVEYVPVRDGPYLPYYPYGTPWVWQGTYWNTCGSKVIDNTTVYNCTYTGGK